MNKPDLIERQPILTICIPTFDRPEQLAATVSAVLPQLTDEVRLTIIDNASPVDAESALTHVVASWPDAHIEIHRNISNIGGSANVLRCFEYCRSEWLWVLGDDDVPSPNAVDKALKQIAENSNALSINFNSPYSSPNEDSLTQGRSQLIETCSDFAKLIFISVNLYRNVAMRNFLHIGHRYAYSMAPHLAMLLMAAGDSEKVVFRNDDLVQSRAIEATNHWSYIGQALSFPTLLELPLSREERFTLATHLRTPRLRNVVIQVLATGIRRKEFDTSTSIEASRRSPPRPPTRTHTSTRSVAAILEPSETSAPQMLLTIFQTSQSGGREAVD